MKVDFLHSQTPSGMPLHELLKVKVGCPIMHAPAKS